MDCCRLAVRVLPLLLSLAGCEEEEGPEVLELHDTSHEGIILQILDATDKGYMCDAWNRTQGTGNLVAICYKSLESPETRERVDSLKRANSTQNPKMRGPDG